MTPKFDVRKHLDENWINNHKDLTRSQHFSQKGSFVGLCSLWAVVYHPVNVMLES